MKRLQLSSDLCFYCLAEVRLALYGVVLAISIAVTSMIVNHHFEWSEVLLNTEIGIVISTTFVVTAFDESMKQITWEHRFLALSYGAAITLLAFANFTI